MDLSLVVPSFKQAPTIRDDLRTLTEFLDSLHYTYEIILVIDGDIDNTADIIASDASLTHVRVEVLPQNMGKGFALKYGLAQATGNITGFIDAGSDIDYESIRLMINIMNFSKADIVIGSKRHPLSEVRYPLIRRIYSAGYQLIYQTLFRLNVRDTQVGVKLFQRNTIQTILPHIHINRFAFDLELLILAQEFGYTNIIESPVRIQHAFRSTVSIAAVLQTLNDTILLFFRKKQKKFSPKPSSGVAVHIMQANKKTREYERELAR